MSNEQYLEVIKKHQVLHPDKNRTYIDVGAGNGDTMFQNSSLFNSVLAYEPRDEYFNLLESKYGSSSKFQLRQYPLYGSVVSGNMVNHDSDYYFEESNNGDINCRVLDFENIHIVDFLKVDTCGNEAVVLKGAKELLLRCKPLVQVTITHHKWNNGSSVVDFMREIGYKILTMVNNVAFFWIPEKCANIENNTLYCFWTGNNEMSANRLGCLYNLRTQTDANVVLVTVDNLHTFIKPDDPLHEAYQYLSETHKCDYLRVYFMHHYGGGYSDIKSPRRSWAEAFQQMRSDPTKIINGYHEKGDFAIAYTPNAHKWNMLCGNGSYILRPKTALTYTWYRAMLDKMDEKIVELRAHPATRVEDAKEWGGGYPIEWNEMLGRIFHRVLGDFEGYILYTTPKVYGGWYR